jgi:N-acetylneuraminate synthase
MTPKTWRDMVDHTRELERALGSSDKQLGDNEQETVIIQRRCLRAARDIQKGERFTRDMIAVLRPAVIGSIYPYEVDQVIGTRAIKDIGSGEELRWIHLSE